MPCRMPRMHRRHLGLATIVPLTLLTAGIPAVTVWSVVTRYANAQVAARAAAQSKTIESPVEVRRRADFAAMQTFRPGFEFWRHIFTLPDGSIAFGSAVDGRLLATFPAKGDWIRQAVWADPSLAHTLDGQELSI